MLADEVFTPDSSRYWPAETTVPAWFRPASTSSSSATGCPAQTPAGTGTAHSRRRRCRRHIAAATRDRYIEAYERISGLALRRLDRADRMTALRHRRSPNGSIPAASITGTSSSTRTNGYAKNPIPRCIGLPRGRERLCRPSPHDLEPLRQKIFDEIKARTKETDLSVPTRHGNWWYYGRSFEGKQYGVHCRCPVAIPMTGTRRSSTNTPRSPVNRCCSTRTSRPRATNSSSRRGRCQPGRQCARLFRRCRRRRAIHAAVQGLTHRRAVRRRDRRHCGRRDLGGGHRTVYYCTVDDAWRPDTVWRYRLGCGMPSEQVYHEPDERFWLGGGPQP